MLRSMQGCTITVGMCGSLRGEDGCGVSSYNAHCVLVGDYRVQFSYSGRHGDLYTAVGRQAGREVRPYQTETGEELLLLHQGVRGAGEVFQTEHNNNRTATWIYRLAGWFGE